MIIGIVTLVAGVIAAVIILSGDGRPSLTRTICGIPFAVVAMSTPFLFEQGCNDGSNSAYSTRIVARGANGALTTHEGIAWCPKRCVNVPAWVDTWVTLPSGLTFKARFTVKDPVALVRALKLDTVDHVVPTEEVARAASTALRPYLNGYLETHMEQLLRRALHQDAALVTTHREIVAYLAHPTVPGDGHPVAPSAVPFSTLGFKLLELCCTRVARAGGS